MKTKNTKLRSEMQRILKKHQEHGLRYAIDDLESLFTLREQEIYEKMKPRIGMLRMWLNEDRIKDAKRFVTNEQIEHWLFEDIIDELSNLKGK